MQSAQGSPLRLACSWGGRLWLRFCHRLVGLFFRLVTRLQVEGWEHIPSQGGVVLVSNHLSMLDTLAIPYAVMATHGIRTVWAPAKAELFRVPILKWILRSWGVFPVRRGRGDRRAIRRLIALMSHDRVMLFPEGTRSKNGQLQPGQRMVGKLLHGARPVIVPVAVWGTQYVRARGIRSLWNRVPVVIRYGAPLDMRHYYALPDTGATAEAIVGEVMSGIAALLDTVRHSPCGISR